MPLFHASFEQSVHVIIEAESLEEATAAVEGAVGEDWLYDPHEWVTNVHPVRPEIASKAKPEMGVVDGELLAYEDYEAAKKAGG